MKNCHNEYLDVLLGCVAALLLNQATQAAVPDAKPVPTGMRAALQAGQAEDVIVEFESSSIDEAAAQLRSQLRVPFAHPRIMELREQRSEALKTTVFARLPAAQYERVRRYSHLPMELVRLRNPAALQLLLDSPEVRAIHRDEVKFPVLDSVSTSLINLSTAQASGLTGAGATVAVIDTGVNYTHPDFGCTSPGVPGSCKVSYYQNFADNSTPTDSNGHGSNVSGIVVGVAPGAKVAALNVFGASSTTNDSKIIAALNWALSNQAAYNIVAVNMSLGDNINHGASCSVSVYNAPIMQLRNLGVEIYAASGNNGFTGGVTSPACVSGVNAVGAVYATNIGGVNWTICTDSTTAAEMAACFSNLPPSSGSLAYNFLLAPGVNIVAGGYIASGTSQATPFAAGAQALIAGSIPQDMPAAFNRAGQSPGYYMNLAAGVDKAITRPGYSATLQRLDLGASLKEAGDNFDHAVLLPAVANNFAADKEAGEPNHAGNPGGRSIWGRWTAPYSGPVQLDTHGSNFDTVLAVYAGLTVASLTQLVANDDDGSGAGNSSVTFHAQAGTEYRVAVDGKNGAAGVFGMLFAVPNDNFANATLLSGNSGTLTASNWFATAETGEANHAGAAPQKSVWWRWTAPVSGQFTVHTQGSSIDTVVAVATGSSVSNTTTVGANDNDNSANATSGVVANVVSGTTYRIAVDVKGATGQLGLTWSFANTVQADLSLTMAGGSAEPSASFNYMATITNVGPASATSTQFTLSLPGGVSYLSAQRADGGSVLCTPTGQVVNCTIGNVYAGSVVTILVTATAANAGQYVATGSISSSITDPVSGNNAAAATEEIGFQSPMGDTPTLPQWAAMLMAALLLVAIKNKTGPQCSA